jgi:hypothetical protein
MARDQQINKIQHPVEDQKDCRDRTRFGEVKMFKDLIVLAQQIRR